MTHEIHTTGVQESRSAAELGARPSPVASMVPDCYAGAMSNGPYTALLMAGSRGPTDVIATHGGVSHKALAPIAGRPMIEYVLDALVAAPEVGKIVAVIEEPEALRALPLVRELESEGTLEIELAKPSPSQSVTAALDAADRYPVLITTADHPLLTPEMIAEFVRQVPDDVDVAALVARDTIIKPAYPHVKRTYLRFSDGAVSGCNLFALPTARGRNAVAFWRRLERDRKKPWKMAISLGPRTLLRLAFRRLTMRHAADAIGRQAGARAAILESSYPNAAVDVDKVSDHELVESILERR